MGLFFGNPLLPSSRFPIQAPPCLSAPVSNLNMPNSAIEIGAGCRAAFMAFYLLGLNNIVVIDISLVMPAVKLNLKRDKPVLNKALKTLVFYWNNQDQIKALNPPFNVVNAADVVYVEESAGQLVGAMEALVADDGVVLLGHQLRSPEAHQFVLGNV